MRIPLFSLIIPFILEGVGLRISRQTFLLLYLFYPFLLFVLNIRKSSFHLPPCLTFFALLFLLFTNVAAFFFSLDKQVSFEYFLFSVSLFLIFIFFYNHKEKVQKAISIFIGLLGIFFIGYSLLIPFFKTKGFQILIPFMEKQVVYPTYSTHNHLGDFLGLLLILILIRNIHKKPLLLLVSFFSIFFFFIMSFSRSAYLAFFIVFVIFLVQQYKKMGRSYLLIGLIGMGTLLMVFFISSSRDTFKTFSLIKTSLYINRFIAVVPRELIAGRDIYTLQALSSIKNHPFGMGGGNFILASLKYNTDNNVSDSAHNIFLETAVENGVVATICLLVISVFLVICTFKHPSSTGYLFLYLLINFQTDYTYQIYLFIVLAVLFAAAAYHEQNEIKIPGLLYGIGTLFLVALTLPIIISSSLLNQNRPFEALILNPFNKEAYIRAIQQSKGNEELIQKALSIAPYDTGIILAATKEYLGNKQKNKALILYEKAYDANHLLNFEIMKQIYFLKKEMRSPQEAERFLKEITLTFKQNFASDDFKKEFAEFCKQAQLKSCEKIGWN